MNRSRELLVTPHNHDPYKVHEHIVLFQSNGAYNNYYEQKHLCNNIDLNLNTALI